MLVGPGAQDVGGEAESWVGVVGEKAKVSAAPCLDGAEEAEMGSPRRSPVIGQEAMAKR